MEMSAEQITNQTPSDRRRLVNKLKQIATALEQQVGRPELWFKLDAGAEDRERLAFIAVSDFR